MDDSAEDIFNTSLEDIAPNVETLNRYNEQIDRLLHEQSSITNGSSLRSGSSIRLNSTNSWSDAENPLFSPNVDQMAFSQSTQDALDMSPSTGSFVPDSSPRLTPIRGASIESNASEYDSSNENNSALALLNESNFPNRRRIFRRRLDSTEPNVLQANPSLLQTQRFYELIEYNNFDALPPLRETLNNDMQRPSVIIDGLSRNRPINLTRNETDNIYQPNAPPEPEEHSAVSDVDESDTESIILTRHSERTESSPERNSPGPSIAIDLSQSNTEYRIIFPVVDIQIQNEMNNEVIEIDSITYDTDISISDLLDENSSTPSIAEPEEPPAKCPKIDVVESDDSQTCPICFDAWTNAGEHRLVSLKCGHLFGSSCITRWLSKKQNRVCPTCKAKSVLRDIRYIYARSVSYVDNSETEAMKAELERVTMEKNRKELEIQKMEMQHVALTSHIKVLEDTIDNLKKFVSEPVKPKANWRFSLEKNVEIVKDSGCRVCAYHNANESLFVSQINFNRIFPGYGVRQMRCENYTLEKIIYLHSKEIRAVTYSVPNNLLMTASLDKNIKMLPHNEDKECITIPTELPLWSCCWDSEQTNRIYAGAIGGVIMQYDIRQTKTSLCRLSPIQDLSPVISLASIPGGLISCQLNTIKSHKKNLGLFDTKVLNLEGPFLNLNYEPISEKFVVSARPCALISYCRHVVCSVHLLDDNPGEYKVVHTYNGGNKQMLMSKTCQFNSGTTSLFAAYVEDAESVKIWNVNSHEKILSLRSTDRIVDICSWTHGSDIFMATLSQNRAKIHKIFFN